MVLTCLLNDHDRNEKLLVVGRVRVREALFQGISVGMVSEVIYILVDFDKLTSISCRLKFFFLSKSDLVLYDSFH